MRSSSVRAMPSWPTTMRAWPRSGRSTTTILRCAGACAGGGGPGSTSAPLGHAPKRARSAAITACGVDVARHAQRSRRSGRTAARDSARAVLRVEPRDGLGRARDRQPEAVRAVDGAARVPARERRGIVLRRARARRAARARARCASRASKRGRSAASASRSSSASKSRESPRDAELDGIPVGARGEARAERVDRLGEGERVALARAALEQLGHERDRARLRRAARPRAPRGSVSADRDARQAVVLVHEHAQAVRRAPRA